MNDLILDSLAWMIGSMQKSSTNSLLGLSKELSRNNLNILLNLFRDLWYNVFGDQKEAEGMGTTEKKDALENVIKAISSELFPLLDESQRRVAAGIMANAIGRGGKSIVSGATGMSRNTVSKGADEASAGEPPKGRIRKEGAGRKREAEKQPGLVEAIDAMLQATTYGDPDRVMVYTSLSLRKMSEGLMAMGFTLGKNAVSRIVESLDYSRQKNRKLQQVTGLSVDPARRDAQFEHIHSTAKARIAVGLPVISIDCKKKETLGNLANSGTEYRKKGDPRRVLDHDFETELGKIAPYGVYVENDNTAFVNLGTSSDTAEFAAESVRAWWSCVGKNTFPDAGRLYVTCDGGGSNGSRSRLWKLQLAKLAQESGLEIEVSHFPPGTSKWNRVEHRLFAYITKSWAGKPLIDLQTAVRLIGSTTTSKGLKVTCRADEREYRTGIRVSAEDWGRIIIEYPDPSNKWNYVIKGLRDESEVKPKPKRPRGRPKKATTEGSNN